MSIQCWLESSLTRVYPRTEAGTRRSLTLLAARGERLSFQVCVRNPSLQMESEASLSCDAPDDLDVTVRRVGYVPQAHLNTVTPEDELDGIGHVPGYVPDPLYPESTVKLGPGETHSFWVTVRVPADTAPGARRLKLAVQLGSERCRSLMAALDVRPLVVRPPEKFLVGHWFYADAICDWCKVSPYEERFWSVVRPYMADYMAHGNNTMFVPHLTPPINGEHRPHQLLRVSETSPGRYRFDFSDVRRWFREARSQGARSFFWSHLFTQWGAKQAARVYRNNADEGSLLWPRETEATSDVYRQFLLQYMPRLERFMNHEGVLDCSFMQISDEPFGEEALENYRKAQAMVRDIAPWIRTMDGLSDVRFQKEGLCDMPIAGLTHADRFRAEDLPHCVYYCCGPRGSFINRLMDTPLVKIRMSGWLFYKLRANGFLHWGYNYWYRGCTPELLDPFTEQAYGEWPFIPYGDPFVVYPGKDGPLDSIRWEVFSEGLSDYALLESAGIDPDDLLLGNLKSYDVFPKSPLWVRRARARVLRRTVLSDEE